MADFGRWQANSFQYKVFNSSNSTYTTLNIGSSSSKIAPADYDGNGIFDMAVFSAGVWTVRQNSTNLTYNWGTTGDLPYPADYDGDNKADYAIYRPSTNTFWVSTSSSTVTQYGLVDKIEVVDGNNTVLKTQMVRALVIAEI
jgi:hypothetical protein